MEKCIGSRGNDPKSRVALEVDVRYPETLLNDRNDLPYLPEQITPPGPKFPKLTWNLNSKSNHVVHHTALKQLLDAGIQLVR